ncbi:MAG: hypothetical protein ACLSCF_07470 [Alistipes finegoldii]
MTTKRANTSCRQSLYFKAALTEGLTFDVAGGIDYRGKERMRWVGSDVWRGAEEQGRAAKSNIRAIGYNVSAHFAYDRTFGAKHHLTAMLGGTFEGSNSVNHINEGYKFFKEDLRATGIQLAENVQPSHVVRLRSQQTALFASACYTFDNRYTIHAGVRGDYTFRYDNSLDDTALYPWASAAWNIAAEPFMQARRSDLCADSCAAAGDVRDVRRSIPTSSTKATLRESPPTSP